MLSPIIFLILAFPVFPEHRYLVPVRSYIREKATIVVQDTYFKPGGTRKEAPAVRALPGITFGAHGRNRTGDPILTMDVLCLLSYMGSYRKDRIKCHINGAGNGIRTRDLQLGRLTL